MRVRRSWLLAGWVALAAVPSTASAQVHYDPDSPAGKQYQIPVERVRGEGTKKKSGTATGSDSPSTPLFGEGVTPVKPRRTSTTPTTDEDATTTSTSATPATTPGGGDDGPNTGAPGSSGSGNAGARTAVPVAAPAVLSPTARRTAEESAKAGADGFPGWAAVLIGVVIVAAAGSVTLRRGRPTESLGA